MSKWYKDLVEAMEGIEGMTPEAGELTNNSPEPCIPRIGVYRDEGPNGRTKLSYEAILFFPAAEANRYKIVYYAHVGQHGEASYEFFNNNTLKPTAKNLLKAGIDQQEFDHLIKEWENMGPEHTPVKLYMRDQQSFRTSRWDWDRQQR
jgi:hypothetical protein